MLAPHGHASKAEQVQLGRTPTPCRRPASHGTGAARHSHGTWMLWGPRSGLLRHHPVRGPDHTAHRADWRGQERAAIGGQPPHNFQLPPGQPRQHHRLSLGPACRTANRRCHVRGICVAHRCEQRAGHSHWLQPTRWLHRVAASAPMPRLPAIANICAQL